MNEEKKIVLDWYRIFKVAYINNDEHELDQCYYETSTVCVYISGFEIDFLFYLNFEIKKIKRENN